MKRRLFAICLVLALSVPALTASAGTPYKTFTRTQGMGISETQTAYEPVSTVLKIGDLSLRNASDLRLGPDNHLYIADTGNRRVIVATLDCELIRVIGEDVLQTPRGVFVDDRYNVYVADEGASQVFVFDNEGALLYTIGRPEHPLFGKYAIFKPMKVVTDKRGNLYIVSKGNTNGVIQIAPGENGEFLGYFGANITRVNVWTRIRKFFLSAEDMSRRSPILPNSVSNLSIDGQGLIYTVSFGDMNDPLKKLNVNGRNTIQPDWNDPSATALAVGPNGNIFVASGYGFLYEYNAEGELIFMFGSRDDKRERVGLFSSVSGVVVDENYHIYALDETKNVIQVFAPTEFTDKVHAAFELFDRGQYIESNALWSEINKMNSLFRYANVGMGEAEFRLGNYPAALASFRAGYNWNGYSDTFWELRSNWLNEHLNIILIIALALGVAAYLLKGTKLLPVLLGPAVKARKKLRSFKMLAQCTYVFHNLRDPNDTAYGIKHEKKTGWRSSFILLFIVFLVYTLDRYASGFLFKYVMDGYFDLFADFITIFGVAALAVCACYLVCTVNEGEASFRELFCGIVYALAPYLALKPVGIVLTNVLTYNEAFFITLIDIVAYVWSVLLILLAIKNLNDYSLRKTLWTVLQTVFVALLMVLAIFVVYVLVSQVIEFVTAISGEAVHKLAS